MPTTQVNDGIGTDANVTTTMYFTRPNATFEERLAVGLTYCLFSSIFLFLQFSILTVFLTYKDYYMHMCYRIMIVISIVDSVQLLVHFYGGIIAICNSALNYWLEKFLGGLLNSFCIALFPLCLVLAAERLLVYLPRIFSPRGEARFVAILIGLSFGWALPFFVAYMTPYTGIVFRSYAWDYDDSLKSKWSFVEDIDESSSMPILAVTFAIYLLILAILIYKRRFNGSGGSSALLIAPHEKRLLLQSLIQFWLELSLNSLWLCQAYSIIPDFPLSEASINFYWIFFNGVKPILYLIFNAPIRERTLRMWLCKGKEKFQLSNDPIVEIVRQTAPRSSIPSAISIFPPRQVNSAANFAPRLGAMDRDIRYSNGQLVVGNNGINNGNWSRSSRAIHPRPSLPPMLMANTRSF